jgi:hypothetical protein
LPSWKKSMLMSMHRLRSSTKIVDIKLIKLDLLLLVIVLLVSNHCPAWLLQCCEL